MYWWWKMGRDEHFDEIALFDGFFLSTMVYLVVGRIGYVLLHVSELGTLYRSLALLAYPGINTAIGIVAVIVFMILFARGHGWNEWKVGDSLVVSLSMMLIMGGVGAVLNGINPVWQANVLLLIWAIVTFALVSRVRKNFRFYAWYKGESSMAAEGLASLIFGLLTGIYYLGMQQFVIGGLGVAISAFLIYKRVGRREGTLWGKLSNIIRRR